MVDGKARDITTNIQAKLSTKRRFFLLMDHLLQLLSKCQYRGHRARIHGRKKKHRRVGMLQWTLIESSVKNCRKYVRSAAARSNALTFRLVCLKNMDRLLTFLRSPRPIPRRTPQQAQAELIHPHRAGRTRTHTNEIDTYSPTQPAATHQPPRTCAAAPPPGLLGLALPPNLARLRQLRPR